jgi:uncharacterized protein
VGTPARFRHLEHIELIGRRVAVADTPLSRLLGLALLAPGCAGEGLLIPDCGSVHTFGMRFALDLLFLDAGGRVVELRRGVPPRRVIRCSAAAAVLEIPSPLT